MTNIRFKIGNIEELEQHSELTTIKRKLIETQLFLNYLASIEDNTLLKDDYMFHCRQLTEIIHYVRKF